MLRKRGTGGWSWRVMGDYGNLKVEGHLGLWLAINKCDRGTWYQGAGYKVILASCYVDRVKPVVFGIPAGKAYQQGRLILTDTLFHPFLRLAYALETIFPNLPWFYRFSPRISLNTLSVLLFSILCTYKHKTNHPISGNSHPSATANKAIHSLKIGGGDKSLKGKAVAEWLSSRIAEQGVRGSILGLATWILEKGYHLLLPSRDMTKTVTAT